MLIQSFSGIRGIYNKDLTDDIARRYAYVFNEFLKKKLKHEPTIVVGYDTRPSNKALKQAITHPLSDIIDVGIMPVAAIELAVREYKADAGIVITASHNPPNYNGLKFLDKDGAVLRPEDIDRIIRNFNKKEKIIIGNKNPNRPKGRGIFNVPNTQIETMHINNMHPSTLSEGVFETNKKKTIVKKNSDLIKRYSGFLKKIVGNVNNKTKVLLDVNGGSGIILKEIIKILELDNIKIINDKAGKFKRQIEPNENSLKYLKGIIKEESAEFAAGFDCDADRVEILLKNGALVDGNYLLALIADDILNKKKGTVVTNDATSHLITKIAEKHNCKVKEVEVGEINVVDEMLKLKSPIGGEGSNGGVIIPPSRCRDGILSVLYLLKIINKKNSSLNQLIKELPKYHTIQKKIKFDKPINNKRIKNRIKKYYLRRKYIIQETGGISGGIKVIINKNTFVWFRVSKTEANLLRIITDSTSKTESNKLLAEAFSLL